MTLRAPLQQLQAELDFLPEPSATLLVPWIRRMAAAIGPLRIATPAADGEPDGFDGIDRRGRYERLLLSEWLVAEAHPLEFVRRASTGEHAFHSISRRDPAAGRASVVLFDAGPAQLGTPRLVHLALFMVFQRRAALGRAEFAWGVAQEPGRLHTTTDRTGLEQLLQSRTHEPLASSQLTDWIHHLGETMPGADDRWLVGGEVGREASLPPGHGFCTVSPAPSDDGKTITVSLGRRPGRTGESVALDLPPSADATRLIRDPFAEPLRSNPIKQGSHTAIAPWGPLAFSPTGNRILVETESGDVVAHHVPNSPHEPRGRKRLLRNPRDERVLAAGMLGRRIVALSARGDRLYMRRVGKSGQDRYVDTSTKVVQALTERETMADGPEPGWAPLLRMRKEFRVHGDTNDPPGSERFVFLAANGVLWVCSWSEDRLEATLEEVDRDVLCVRADDPRHYLYELGGDYRLSGGGPGPAGQHGGGQVFAHYGGNPASANTWPFGHVALRVDDGTIRVWTSPMARQTFRAPIPDERYVGVVLRDSEVPMLVTVNRDQHKIGYLMGHTYRELHRFAQPITRAAVCPAGNRLAALTEDGQLWVYSFEYGQTLVHLVRGGPA